LRIGRNEPCPCGSGKKYKKCCMGRDEGPIAIADYQVKGAYSSLMEKLLKCFERHFKGDCMELAVYEFLLWPEQLMKEEMLELFHPLVLHWLFFSWALDPTLLEEEKGIDAEGPSLTTTAELLQKEASENQLGSLEQALLEEGMDSPLSFWEVQIPVGRREVVLKDCFTLREVTVIDGKLAKALEHGDILYGPVLTVAGRSMLAAVAPIIMPPMCKPEIISLREHLVENGSAVDPETLMDAEDDLRELFFHLFERRTKPPTLTNTDGDLLAPHTIRYQVDAPEYALEQLHSLSVNETHEEILARATKNRAGRLRQVSFDWSREEHDHPQGWTNTVLGKIAIDGKRMVVTVNSAERAARIRDEIEGRLGRHALHKGTSVQSLASLMKEHAARDSFEDPNQQPLDPNTIPELRQALDDMLIGHWRKWVDMNIPALGGKTPRAAVASPSGREAVVALLLDAERHARRDPRTGKANLQGIAETRHTLGLE